MHRNCGSSALLVGGDHRLPSDPCEYNYEASFGPGCNNLRCTSCGAFVRTGPLGVHLKEGRRPDLAALYAAQAWTSLPFIDTREGGGWRLYACKCQWWEELSEHFLDNDHDSPGEPDLSWVCAGHPAPVLPVTLGELTLSAQTDWSVVVGRILDGTCPRPLARGDEGPWLWLTWLYAYLSGLTEAARLSRAVAQHVDERDDHALAAALCFFRQFPAADGFERVVVRAEVSLDEVLTTHYAPKNEYRPSVWDVLIARLRQRSTENHATEARAVEVVRKVMLLPARDPDKITRTLDTYSDAFRTDDFGWMAENIVALEAAGPGRWINVMNLLVSVANGAPELDHLVVIAGIALIESRQVSTSDIRAWLEKRGSVKHTWVLPLQASLENKP